MFSKHGKWVSHRGSHWGKFDKSAEGCCWGMEDIKEGHCSCHSECKKIGLCAPQMLCTHCQPSGTEDFQGGWGGKAADTSVRFPPFFHHSTAATQWRKKNQKLLGLEKHKLMTDVCTRWNSTYNMVNFLEQKPAISATLLNSKPTDTLRWKSWQALTPLSPAAATFFVILNRQVLIMFCSTLITAF